jgi:hypothetical protein
MAWKLNFADEVPYFLVETFVELVDFLCQVKLEARVDMVKLVNRALNPLHLLQLFDRDKIWRIIILFFNFFLCSVENGIEVVRVRETHNKVVSQGIDDGFASLALT